MNDLPALYAAVCAKRPELAVMSIGAPGVRMYYDAESFGWYWDDPAPKHIGDRFAAALILARWVEALPFNHALVRENTDALKLPKWYIDNYASRRRGDTPLEALAAFYLEYAK